MFQIYCSGLASTSVFERYLWVAPLNRQVASWWVMNDLTNFAHTFPAGSKCAAIPSPIAHFVDSLVENSSHVFVADLRLITVKPHKIILTFWLVCILSEPKILVSFLFEWDWLSHFYSHTKLWTKNHTFSYQFDDCSTRLYGYKSQLSTVIIIVFQQVKSVFSLI